MAKTPPVEPARAAQAALKPVSAATSDPTSPEAMARIADALQALKLHTIVPLLNRAVAEVRADRHQQAAELVVKALELDERCAVAWHILGVCREKAGDFTTSLACYESALQLNPDEPEIANDIGRLAYVMGMHDIAEQLFARYLLHRPGSVEGTNNLACAQRDLLRYDEAVETLRPVIYANPESALLWNTLGTIISEQGEMEQAMTFYDEALRLQPGFAKARYNRGNVRLALGDPQGALEDVEAALPQITLESEITMMKLARATMKLASGDLGPGWDGYEERLSPSFVDVTHFMVEKPRWTPETEVRGRHVLVVGEQGLGDEVVFANVLPDLIEAVGPDGLVSLGVEPRLIPLFKRSFPTIQVGRHDTYKVDHHTVRVVKWAEDERPVDCYAPLASLMRGFRRSLDAFPDREAFLVPDPERVAHWKRTLAELGDGPKVGVVWKSLKINSGRIRYFSPFEQWATVLKTPGVRFVNLQYGDCAEELALAQRTLGVEIWNPPGIDLKDDLDDVAALTCALDLSIGPANATTNLAAASGGKVWLISTPGAWPRLGTDHYPWYPSARVFTPLTYNRWAPVMDAVAQALSELA